MKAVLSLVLIVTLPTVLVSSASAQLEPSPASNGPPPVYVVPIGEPEPVSHEPPVADLPHNATRKGIEEARVYPLGRGEEELVIQNLRMLLPGVQIIPNARRDAVVVVSDDPSVFEKIETPQVVGLTELDTADPADAPPASPAASPALVPLLDDPEVRSLLEELGRQEVIADSLAAEIRTLRKNSDQSSPRESKLRADLEKALHTALAVKSKLEQFQVESLERRISEHKKQLSQRKQMAKQIVKLRADALTQGDMFTMKVNPGPVGFSPDPGDEASSNPLEFQQPAGSLAVPPQSAIPRDTSQQGPPPVVPQYAPIEGDAEMGFDVLPNDPNFHSTKIRWSGPEGMLITLADVEFGFDDESEFEHAVERRTNRLMTVDLTVKYPPELQDAVLAGRLELYPLDPGGISLSAVPIRLHDHDIRDALEEEGFILVAYYRKPDDPASLSTVEILTSSAKSTTPGQETIAEAARRGTIVAVLKLARDRNSRPLTIPPKTAASEMSQPATHADQDSRGDGPKGFVRSIPLNEFVARVACSPDGKRIAAATYDGLRQLYALKVIDVETGSTVTTLSHVKLGLVSGALETWDSNIDPDFKAQDVVTAIEFSPDGKRLAVGTFFGQVKIVDPESGALLRVLGDEITNVADLEIPPVLKSLKRALGSVLSLAFSPDGKRLAICGESQQDAVQVWHPTADSVRLSEGPARLKVWNLADDTVNLFYGHSRVHAVTFSSDGSLLASAGRWDDGRESGSGVMIWDPQSTGGTELRRLNVESKADCYSVFFAPTQQQLVTAIGYRDTKDNLTRATIRVTDATNGIIIWERPVPESPIPCGFLSDGQTIVLRGAHDTIRLLDVATGDEVRTRQLDLPSIDKGTNWVIIPRRNWLLIAPECQEPEEGCLEMWSLDEVVK